MKVAKGAGFVSSPSFHRWLLPCLSARFPVKGQPRCVEATCGKGGAALSTWLLRSTVVENVRWSCPCVGDCKETVWSSFYLGISGESKKAAAPCWQEGFLAGWCPWTWFYPPARAMCASPLLFFPFVFTLHPAQQPSSAVNRDSFCFVFFVFFPLNLFFCSHLFQLSDFVNQMRNRQAARCYITHCSPPRCRGGREGSWGGD